MGKEKTSKGRVIDDAFRKEAVRILASSGRTIKAVVTCPPLFGPGLI